MKTDSPIPFCKHSNAIESIKHPFLKCPCIHNTCTWNKMLQAFKCLHICKSVKFLYTLVVGYKISHNPDS